MYLSLLMKFPLRHAQSHKCTICTQYVTCETDVNTSLVSEQSRRLPQRNHSPSSGRNCRVIQLQTLIVVDLIHLLTTEIPTSSIFHSLHTSLSPHIPLRICSSLFSLFSEEVRAPSVCDDYSACELCCLWWFVWRTYNSTIRIYTRCDCVCSDVACVLILRLIC